jgi:hypothetical protein
MRTPGHPRKGISSIKKAPPVDDEALILMIGMFSFFSSSARAQ